MLLDMSKIEAGSLSLLSKMTQLNTVVNSVVSTGRVVLEGKPPN